MASTMASTSNKKNSDDEEYKENVDGSSSSSDGSLNNYKKSAKERNGANNSKKNSGSDNDSADSVEGKGDKKLNNGNDSDSESDNDTSDDDAFCFKRQKFKGRRKEALSGQASPRPGAGRGRGRPRGSGAKGAKRRPAKRKIESTSDSSDSDSDSSSSDGDNEMISQKYASIAKRQQNGNKKTKPSGKITMYELDSDEDSDDGIFKNSQDQSESHSNNGSKMATTNTVPSNSSKFIQSPPSMAASATVLSSALLKQKNAISLSDSDSEDDINTSFTPSAKAALEKAMKAKEMLEKKCTDNDDDDGIDNDGITKNLNMDDDSDIEVMETSFATKTPQMPSISKPIAPIIGPFIQLKLRTMIQSRTPNSNGHNNQHEKLLHNKENQVRFRTGTPLQKLVDKYHSMHPITKFSIVKFSFDGQNMIDMNKTLAMYGLEDEDLIDVIVSIPPDAEFKMNHMNQQPQQQSSLYSTLMNTTAPNPFGRQIRTGVNPRVAATATSLEPNTAAAYIKINTRIKNGDPEKTHMYQLKAIDPFDKLLKAYRNKHGYSSHRPVFLEYNNVRIKGEQSPADLGMNDGCLVEICDEAERVKQVNRMPKSAMPSGSMSTGVGTGTGLGAPAPVVIPRGGISLKVRINGDDKSIISYGIMMNAPFQTLMDKVYELNKISKDKCKFQFDGQALNPRGTPEDEDLEGDEVIDVQIDKGIASTTQSSTTNKNPTQTKQYSKQYEPKGKAMNVLTLRNNVKGARTKKFLVRDDSTVSVLRSGYIKYYGKKGCRSVTFYLNSVPITDLNLNFATLGVKQNDVLAAMENGRAYA